MVIFLWITPMPPSRAMAMARLASVTVSMAAEIIGIFMGMFLESLVLRLTSRGITSEYDGTSRTSSKVKPSDLTLSSWKDIFAVFLRVIKLCENTKKMAILHTDYQ
jgi:hypothetical protein